MKGGERLQEFSPWSVGGSSLFVKIALGFVPVCSLVIVILTCAFKFRQQIARQLINSVEDYSVSSDLSAPRINQRLEAYFNVS